MALTKLFPSIFRDDFIRLSGRLVVVVMIAVACSPSVRVGSGPAAVATPASSQGVDMRQLEREVLVELNAARTNPPAYARYLSELLPTFNGKVRRRSDGMLIRTQEGAAAVREAIDALNRQAPVPALKGSADMSNAARDLADDQRKSGGVGHTGSDGSNPGTRLARYGTWGTTYDENIDYGSLRNGREVVVDLIVDDGVPDRGHRHNIFDPAVRVAGIACGAHPLYGSVCVIDQAASYAPRAGRRFQN